MLLSATKKTSPSRTTTRKQRQVLVLGTFRSGKLGSRRLQNTQLKRMFSKATDSWHTPVPIPKVRIANRKSTAKGRWTGSSLFPLKVQIGTMNPLNKDSTWSWIRKRHCLMNLTSPTSLSTITYPVHSSRRQPINQSGSSAYASLLN